MSGIIVLILIVAGIGLLTKTRKLPQTELQKQSADEISQLMKIVNDPNSTKADVEGAWLGIGIYYESLGQRDKEKDAFFKAAETDPNSYLPWSDLGTFYVETKAYDKAAEAFQKALSLSDKDPQLWLKWINFLRYQVSSDDKHIRIIFNDAYKATNNSDLLLRQGASYLEETGDIKGAIAAWQFVLKLEPNDATVKAEIVRLSKMQKK